MPKIHQCHHMLSRHSNSPRFAYISRTCKYALPVRLALLGVSCRWEHDSPRHFILICLLGVNFLCYHCSFHPKISVAKWTIDLQALSMAHTRHVVLLPIQSHFCECLELLVFSVWVCSALQVVRICPSSGSFLLSLSLFIHVTPRSHCLRPGESTTFLIGHFPGAG